MKTMICVDYLNVLSRTGWSSLINLLKASFTTLSKDLHG